MLVVCACWENVDGGDSQSRGVRDSGDPFPEKYSGFARKVGKAVRVLYTCGEEAIEWEEMAGDVGVARTRARRRIMMDEA